MSDVDNQDRDGDPSVNQDPSPTDEADVERGSLDGSAKHEPALDDSLTEATNEAFPDGRGVGDARDQTSPSTGHTHDQ